ncbi:MAG: TetR/AcrR family transcriptional regulator [Planctomycetota bacterium]|nr:MAG: TetR/AcrR family transcriptional regulator [Planctomycetota bacterium]
MKSATAASLARKPRADGVASRHAILDAACRLATTHGLEGLSIGELAEHIGMSKSGLYAHFKSKEELQLATIDAAISIFNADVLEPARKSRPGLARVNALVEGFLGHLARRVFPAGCFFATVAAQLAARPGRPRDKIVAVQQSWAGEFARALEQAREAGEIGPGVDRAQLVFELMAMLFLVNFEWVVTEDPGVLEKARLGVKRLLSAAKRPG